MYKCFLQGLRELLDISQKSKSSPKLKKIVSNVHKEVQTEEVTDRVIDQEVSVTLPMPPQPKPPPRSPKVALKKVAEERTEIEKTDVRESIEVSVAEVGSGDEDETDETGSEDDSIKYDTIKLADVRRNKKNKTETAGPEVDKPSDLSLEETETSPSPEQKLSPSEELVTHLVDQLVSDSMAVGDKTDSPSKTNKGKNKKVDKSRNSSKKSKK